MLVPKRIRELKPYIAGKSIEQVVEQYHPPRISKLASNENRLGSSGMALQAALDSMLSLNNYPDPASLKLRQKLAAGFNLKTANVIAGSGSEGVMSVILRTFMSGEEEALTASATFIGFTVLANSHGLRLRQVPLTGDYRFDLPALAGAITGKTRLIYLSNPNNPTGTSFTRSEWEAFMDQVPPGVLVILDEAYFEFASGFETYPDSMDYRFDNVITLRTFSKAYGLAGLRIGYGLGAQEIISNLMKVKLPFEPSAPAQAAGLAALDDKAFLDKTRLIVRSGREQLYRFLEAQGVAYVPSMANFVMAVFPTGREAVEFTAEMLKRGVILRRLPAFGLPHCVRITIGLPGDMEHFEESFLKVSRG
ncbi:MAG: histidinol-phosphate transaminase [Balneolales bacterium]